MSHVYRQVRGLATPVGPFVPEVERGLGRGIDRALDLRAPEPATAVAEICRGCAARQKGFCRTLPAGTLLRLAEASKPVTQGPNHWFWDSASSDRFVSVVRRGYLRLLQYSSDGRRMITGIAGPGAIVGEVLRGRGRYGLESSTDVSLCTFDRADLERLMTEEPVFRRRLYAERTRVLDALYEHIWERGLQTPEQRLASFFLRARSILPYQPLPTGGGVLTLVVPRADIADLIGTSRETISRLTHQWQTDGVIRMPEPRFLVIEDVAQLTRIAGWAAENPPTATGAGAGAAAGEGLGGDVPAAALAPRAQSPGDRLYL